jgi:hypothetical protein
MKGNNAGRVNMTNSFKYSKMMLAGVLLESYPERGFHMW